MVTNTGLEVVQIPAGKMKNFAYLVYCPNSGDALAVDSQRDGLLAGGWTVADL